jgi:hypothetical protein
MNFVSKINPNLSLSNATERISYQIKGIKSPNIISLVPMIYPNRRNTKDPIVIARLFDCFDKEQYKERYKVERTFGWQDTYRRLAISYDRLEETHLGFRNLAYAMINFRFTFNSY